jgi:hypothetical protein
MDIFIPTGPAIYLERETGPANPIHSPHSLMSFIMIPPRTGRSAIMCMSRRYARLAACGILPVLLIATLLPSCNLLGTVLSLGLVKLQYGCLPEGTRIDTPDGPMPVEQLKAGDVVTGFHGDPVRIEQVHQYAEDPATSRHLTIHFTNGAVVSASPRHRIDGTPASMLKPGDACGGTTVDRITPCERVSRSFDLLTGDPGYRISGIPVNSMIEEMHDARE